MSKIIYDKLIRDRIPEIIENAGKKSITRVMKPDEYRDALREKLKEEVEEFLTNEDLSEIADILEVLESIVHDYGVGMEEIYSIKATKKKDRGGFSNRLFLESVEE